MHKRFAAKRGFTIVELTVVIAVLAILATIGVLAYTLVIKQSNDSKRQADIEVLAHTLETYYQKKGEYPVGCALDVTACVTVSTSGAKQSDGSIFETSAGDTPITASMTMPNLRSVLPGITEAFGDPSRTDKSKLFLNNTTAGNIYSYLYVGGLYNSGASSVKKYVTFSGNAPLGCELSITLGPKQASSYLIGYYSEQDKKWHIRNGPHGVQFSANGTAPNITCSTSSKAGAIWAD